MYEEGIDIVQSINELSEIGLHSAEDNVLFSPPILHKMLFTLSQDYSYRNSTKLKSVLELYNNDAYIKEYMEFASFLQSFRNNNFSLSSKLLVENKYELQNHFKDFITNFQYEVEMKDLSNPESAAQYISSWVEERTNKLIGDLMNSSSLTDTTCLALLNAVHFKGNWEEAFILNNDSMTFQLNERDSIETQIIKKKAFINCTFQYDYNAIELPCSGNNNDFSLLIMLPHRTFQPQNIAYKCKYMENIMNAMKGEEVELSLPKFKIEQFLDCRNIFKTFNLQQEFEDKMNLFGMLGNAEFLKYNQMNLKGFINVNEEGVQAASGVSVSMSPTKFDDKMTSVDGLKMLEFNIGTTISNRFAKTLVTSKVQNNNESATEATFSMILPETAFITEFNMEINGKNYKSHIKRKNEARAIYNEALSVGKSAGIVESDTRDSTQFTVSVNLEPQSVAIFFLTYEEMLQRIENQYELVLNICPGQLVDNLNVEVNINETKSLKFVKTPPLRSGKEIDQKIDKYLIPNSAIQMVNSNTSIVKFNMDVKEQWRICNYMSTPSSKGFSGQFVIQYDVERDDQDGEILVQDGNFVHFFAPSKLDPLPKHIVFVLDTSTSMRHRKIDQLKDAMTTILDALTKGDLISIVEFNTDVIVWDINSEEPKTIPHKSFKYNDSFEMLNELSLPRPIVVDDQTIINAKNVVQKMFSNGWTFMSGGLETGLFLLKFEQEKKSVHQPMMIFLTDGEPAIGVKSTSEIVEMVTRLNVFCNKAPIFSLSFGEGADKSFLRLLSLRNFGFSKHIYEDSDASLQLQSFYKQICSPLLANIKFNYDSKVTEVTRTNFPIYFKGGELIVSGQCKGNKLSSTINGYGPRGLLHLPSTVWNPVTSLKRLWAYLTIKQLLEEKDVVSNKEELIQRATDLALKYSFVTEVTSLVVVKPDEICDTNDKGTLPEDSREDNTQTAGMKDDGIPRKRMIKKCIIRRRIKDLEPDEICDTNDEETLPEDSRQDNTQIAGMKDDGMPKKQVIKKRIIRGRRKQCASQEEIVLEGEEQEEKKPCRKFVTNRPFLVALLLRRGDRKHIIFIGAVYKPSN